MPEESQPQLGQPLHVWISLTGGCKRPLQVHVSAPCQSLPTHPVNSTPLFSSPCKIVRTKDINSLNASKLSHSFPPVFPWSPIFRTFFQVPYPVTPLFATLTKTAGVCTQNSPFWNRFTPSLAEEPFITRHRIQVLSFQILPHSSALFCAHAKLNSFLFKRFRTLRRKTARGGGAHPISRYNWRCGRKRAG
jgi:hypothetical protein